MKAVMMCAGRSTRTYPLTLTRPKPLLTVANKTIIEHNLEQLEGIVDEVILIIGYKKEMIKNHLGNSYNGLKLTFVEQKEQLGTGHAVLQAEKHIDDRFIVMNGDDLYSGKDIKKLLEYRNGALVFVKEDTAEYGVYYTKKSSMVVTNFIEKPKDSKRGCCNIGCYVFEKDLFNILKTVKKSSREEYELTDAIMPLVRLKGFSIVEVKDFWFPISYPWSLLEANVGMLKAIKKDIKGTIEENVTIKGELILGRGTVIKSGTYIEGPVIIGEDCIIGPFAYIRPDTAIGNNCNIRSEVYDAIIMDSSVAKHHSYVAHSVLGEDVNIGAGTITSDYRHDGRNNMTIINGKKVDSGRRKLGSFMGDHVRTGINTCIYPGRKLWPGVGTLPGEVVTKDKMA